MEYTGVADVVLITDVSGSMGWRFDADWVAGTPRQCDDPNLQDPSTERLSVAKCLDKDFVHEILNISGNEMGLVSYYSVTDSVDPLTTDELSLNNSIDAYSAGGGTCICCGINSAKDELIKNLKVTQIINSGSNWNYTNNSIRSIILGTTYLMI